MLATESCFLNFSAQVIAKVAMRSFKILKSVVMYFNERVVAIAFLFFISSSLMVGFPHKSLCSFKPTIV